jgi:hypothetical protein
MRRGIATLLTIIAGCWLAPALDAVAGDPEAGEPKPPVYVRWLVPGDPGDETIREYWERSQRGELSPAGLVDLGTMLFERGYPKDALEMYREALHRDKTLYEAWLRIGVVEHRAREYEDARHAYHKCLDLMSGHGWCNFYLGLLEEQTGHPTNALEHFERAYEHAPGLADPKVNPEVLQSRLQFGAAVKQSTEERFTAAAPLAFLEPKQVQEVRQQYLPTATPSPTPTAAPVATPTPLARAVRPTPAASPSSGAAATPGATGADNEVAPPSRVRPRRPSGTSPPPTPGPVDEKSPYGVRRPSDSSGIVGGGVRPVSPEASLHPWWRAMPEWILAFV